VVDPELMICEAGFAEATGGVGVSSLQDVIKTMLKA
jgi:hypothetical protein